MAENPFLRSGVDIVMSETSCDVEQWAIDAVGALLAAGWTPPKPTLPTSTMMWGDDVERVCSLCGAPFIGMGNNPEPLRWVTERCCDDCNNTKVIPARIARARGVL
jgi:hypothetical protein